MASLHTKKKKKILIQSLFVILNTYNTPEKLDNDLSLEVCPVGNSGKPPRLYILIKLHHHLSTM